MTESRRWDYSIQTRPCSPPLRKWRRCARPDVNAHRASHVVRIHLIPASGTEPFGDQNMWGKVEKLVGGARWEVKPILTAREIWADFYGTQI